jgi:CCR4-NOT transcription complex subunit 10
VSKISERFVLLYYSWIVSQQFILFEIHESCRNVKVTNFGESSAPFPCLLQMEEERSQKKRYKNALVNEVFGKGLHRKLVVAPMPNSVCSSLQDAEAHSQSAAMPAPTLEFAAICLSNAKFLLPNTPPVVSDDPPTSTPPVPAPPGPPIQGHSISSLRCYVLACQAYVSLGLGDPVTSLASSRELLATPLLSGGLRFLGQVYSAEALVLLGRVSEAMTHLSPESVVNISVSSPKPALKDSDSESVVHLTTHPPIAGPQVHQFPESLSQARAVMLFNTAAVFCITRENDKARKALQEAVKLLPNPPPPQTVLLSAYIELMTGNTAAALHLLKVAHPYPHGMDTQKKHRKAAATYLAMKH